MSKQPELQERWEAKARAPRAAACPAGHQYTPENSTYQEDHLRGAVYRLCRLCHRIRETARYARRG